MTSVETENESWILPSFAKSVFYVLLEKNQEWIGMVSDEQNKELANSRGKQQENRKNGKEIDNYLKQHKKGIIASVRLDPRRCWFHPSREGME